MSKRLIYAEDAIDALMEILDRPNHAEFLYTDEICKVLENLPPAQPQPCKDAVSKADVLETYAELYDVFDDNKEIKNELHKIYDKINALQAAQPKRIKGRWVRKESDLSWWYECSICGESPLFDPYSNEVRSPFCPWCGAEMDMRGDEDG